MKEVHRTETIVLKDGRRLTGLVFDETPDLVLMNGREGAMVVTYHIPSEIASREPEKV